MDLDRHIPGDSPIHRADARVKLVAALAAILVITSLPGGAFAPLGLVWLFLVAASCAARLGPLRLTRGSWVALPFALMALPLAFTRPGEVLLSLPLGWFGPFSLQVTDQGLRDALTIVARSWLCVQVALLLALSTPFTDLLEALRALRLPRLLVGIIGLMYRYLAVLGDEAARMSRARASRSAAARTSGGRLPWRARVTGSMVGSLFLRSYERSERVYLAMQARGFEGTLPGRTPAPPTRAALAVLSVLLTAMLAFSVAAHLWSERW